MRAVATDGGLRVAALPPCPFEKKNQVSKLGLVEVPQQLPRELFDGMIALLEQGHAAR